MLPINNYSSLVVGRFVQMTLAFFILDILFSVFIETETPVTEGSKGNRSGNESAAVGVSKGFSNFFRLSQEKKSGL